jgi:hypothetical protein
VENGKSPNSRSDDDDPATMLALDDARLESGSWISIQRPFLTRINVLLLSSNPAT